MPVTYNEGMAMLRACRIYHPAIVKYGASIHVFTRTELIGSGPSIQSALTAAGVYPPPPGYRYFPFIASKDRVMRGPDRVCRARSNNMAVRIANALNECGPEDGPQPFEAEDEDVWRDGLIVCHAETKDLAESIASALNTYVPGDRNK